MLKSIIAPIQSWLLAKGQCVGCGRTLGKDAKVTCKCGRIFIYDKLKKTHRRALFSEI